ncbi:hypothetical protein V6N13_125960 [Hibiscus sabdariffa]|uniref:Uncharacterized protein n=1 Tax=Hibiscus sabdariffa TaxID=183260 RepID=A0ABR2NX10_9ROSI
MTLGNQACLAGLMKIAKILCRHVSFLHLSATWDHVSGFWHCWGFAVLDERSQCLQGYRLAASPADIDAD